MTRSGYRLMSHTADVGVTAWGETLADAVGAAIRGVIGVTFEPKTIRPREGRQVTIQATELVDQVVRLVGDVIFLVETEGFLPARADVVLGRGSVTAHFRGETYDRDRHRRRGPLVKAVTYHEVRVDHGPPARVRLLLDV